MAITPPTPYRLGPEKLCDTPHDLSVCMNGRRLKFWVLHFISRRRIALCDTTQSYVFTHPHAPPDTYRLNTQLNHPDKTQHRTYNSPFIFFSDLGFLWLPMRITESHVTHACSMAFFSFKLLLVLTITSFSPPNRSSYSRR